MLGSGFFSSLVSFVLYSLRICWFLRRHEYDVVVSTTSRLGTGLLGVLVSKITGGLHYLDIRDLFADTLKSVFSGYLGRLVVFPFFILEEWVFRRADKINIVSEGFRSDVMGKSNTKDLTTFPNGIDLVFSGKDYSNPFSEKKIITYAGNIGEGQGLEILLPKVLSKLPSDFEIHVYGSGSKLLNLKKLSLKYENLLVFAPVGRTELLDVYRRSAILLLHLNALPAFEKVLPSKVFEYGATGKPVLAGVSGYSVDFIKTNLPSWHIFDPCDGEGFLRELSRCDLDCSQNSHFVHRYAREAIMSNMAKQVLSLGCIAEAGGVS